MTTSDWTKLTGHEYDGIKEYDNPIPSWWNWLFAASIVFSIVYAMWYHLGTLSTTIHDNWRNAQTAEYQRIFGEIGDLSPDEPTILRMMDDSQMMALARGIFVGNCAQCHAKDGGGINGVNLTDNTYKNVKVLSDLYQVISKGANNAAMPAWENRLSSNERVLLAAYTATLRGTSPAAPRPAEGTEIPPWPKRSADAPSPVPAPSTASN